MKLFDKLKDGVNQAKNMIPDKNPINSAVSKVKGYMSESKEAKKPLEGAIIRYEFSYIGGLDDIEKAKAGAWGMNIMSDRFAFRVTKTTENWLYDMDILYEDITDIRIEKRTITTTEIFLGAGNDANQQQENLLVIEYKDKERRKSTLRVEMLTGMTIFNQAAKCREMMDILRKHEILDRIKNKSQPNQNQVIEVDILGQIEKLSKLKEAGVLTEEEFLNKKTELLGKL